MNIKKVPIMIHENDRIFLDKENIKIPSDGEFYFYSMVWRFVYRDDFTLFYIPNNVIEDCINGRAKIIIDSSYETYSSKTINDFSDSIIKKYPGIDYKHIIFLTSNLDINSNDVKSFVISDTFMEFKTINNFESNINFDKTRNNNFFSILGRASEHRLMMLSKVIEYKSQGIISCSTRQLKDSLTRLDNYYPDISYKFYDKKIDLPILYDFKDGDGWELNPLHVSDTYYELSSDSYINILCETYYNHPGDEVWFTEKTYKSIEMCVPFILHSSPFSLKRLKIMGYITFDNWFDEDYDNETDLQKRMITIHNLVDTLLTEKNIHDMYVDMKDVLLHNQTLFRQRKQEFPNRIIDKLYDSL